MIVVLHVKDVHYSYAGYPVLSGVSFSVKKGELCGLFGPNGCGKTTLFKCCLRLLALHKGSVHMGGEDVSDRPVEELAKTVSYVPQEHKPPFPYLVREVVLMGRTPHLGGFFGVKRKDKEIALHALDRLEISHLADRPYNQLSGGQRQLVLIARAIAQDTPIMFLDEPTSTLDFHNQMKIWEIMRSITEEGKTILACSHDPNHVAWFCDRVIVISNAGVVADGDPREVINEETLDLIYKKTCSVRSTDGVRIVMPRSIAEKKGERRSFIPAEKPDESCNVTDTKA